MEKKLHSRGLADTTPKYYATHIWVARNFGKASTCEYDPDHSSYRFEWANVSGEYHRERSDWKQVCQKCHAQMDRYKTHCRNGHEYTEQNTSYAPRTGFRLCKKCRAEAAARWRQKNSSNLK